MPLQTQDHVEQARADGAEHEHGERVAAPVLLLVRIGPDEPVEATLGGAEDARRPKRP